MSTGETAPKRLMDVQELHDRIMRLSPSERLVISGALVTEGRPDLAVVIARTACDEIDAAQLMSSVFDVARSNFDQGKNQMRCRGCGHTWQGMDVTSGLTEDGAVLCGDCWRERVTRWGR